MIFLTPLSPQNTIHMCIEMARATISPPIVLWSKIILVTTNRIDIDNNDDDDPHETPPSFHL